MESMLSVLHVYWDICSGIISYSLAFDLCYELHLRTEADVLDFNKFINYSSAAAAIILGRYFWGWLPLPYGQEHVIKMLRAAQGLIADIFAVYISFALYKKSRQSIVQSTLIKFDMAVNINILAYQAVVERMYARYLLTVWLATFQDDWSLKTHNKIWWTMCKFFGHSTPENASERQQAPNLWSTMFTERLVKPSLMLKAWFSLFGQVDDLDFNPHSQSWEL